MPQFISLSSQNQYEIKVFGQPDGSWLGWIGDGNVRTEISADDTRVTTLSDLVMDQAELVGLIRRLHGFGIVFLSIRICEVHDRS